MLAPASAFVCSHCPFERIHSLGDFALFDAHHSHTVPQKTWGTVLSDGLGQFERLAVVLSRFFSPLLSSPQITEETEKSKPLLWTRRRKFVARFIHHTLRLPRPARLHANTQET